MTDFTRAAAALREAKTVALACHIHPDGDALGSLFGLNLALERAGKTTYPTWGDDPVEVPPSYRFLPGSDKVVQPDDVPDVDVFVALDCGGIDRLGSLEQRAKSSPVVINIDHHPGNDEFGSINIVDTKVSSTAELCVALLRALDIAIDKDVATGLYTGIVTDTGRFSYQNSSPATLRLAADLLETGVDAPRIAEEVFESSPFAFLRLVGRVLDRAVLDGERGLVHSYVTQDDLVESGLTIEETGDLIDLIRATRDADVAALFKEQDTGTWKVSIRSRSKSVGDIARARGGGGHDLAAGYTVEERDAGITDLLEALS